MVTIELGLAHGVIRKCVFSTVVIPGYELVRRRNFPAGRLGGGKASQISSDGQDRGWNPRLALGDAIGLKT
jgi:hypothetical protein